MSFPLFNSAIQIPNTCIQPYKCTSKFYPIPKVILFNISVKFIVLVDGLWARAASCIFDIGHWIALSMIDI